MTAALYYDLIFLNVMGTSCSPWTLFIDNRFPLFSAGYLQITF